MRKATTTDVGKSIHVVFDDELVRQLEDWRRRQPRIPTIAEGIRRLVTRGIANDEDARA
jgi:hypothetical protein